MIPLKCTCGGTYYLVPDEDAATMPPSFTAKLFHCSNCDATDWQEAEFFNLEDWPEDLRYLNIS